ncbi:SDR family oxidoreductase [Conexibacter sp. SYSU D00693]|uniref:SDR family oxidoreductase n=1 Tax=Conexibacter sp. SYSU D00693 TaxID=2812560 RepID=UPI00196ACABB|nr:SDR family oxidoreductase [Conexibacter sp. SYSU D00693]
MSVQGKAVLVTGAASGIGKATAVAAARRGARLVLTDLQPLDGAVAEVERAGGTVLLARSLDITDLDAVRALADDVHAAFGSMDVVMNVAGTSAWGSVRALEHRHWRTMVEVDLMGPIHVIESFVPAMMDARRGGHLVNVSSAAGLLGLPWHAAYSAAKFGLRGVSEVLRFDLARYRIGVSLVCPGGVDTPLVGTVEIAGVDRDHPDLRRMTRHFQRHAKTPEQVAERILRGVERGQYLVYTSRDIQAAFLLQRLCPPLYELVMRLMNDQMFRIGRRAAHPSAPRAAAVPGGAEARETARMP